MSLKTPDLQSGAFATQPRMQKEISCVKKTDEGREMGQRSASPRGGPRGALTHFEAHFS